MKRFVLTAVLIVTAFSLGFGQTSEERIGQAFVEAFGNAMGHNDVAALDRQMAPEYTFVNPAGAVQTKEDRLAPMREGDLKYESVVYDEVSERRYGDTVVVIARATVKGHMKAADVSGRFRATLVLQRIKGQWQLVSSQASPIAQ